MMEKLIIIDFYNFLYRAYYGIRPLSSSSGIPTNAIFGLCSMLESIKRTHKPTMIVAALESKKSWRLEEYGDYKAGRKAMPEELKAQIPYIKEIFGLLQIPFYSVEGFEADDVIASLAVRSPHSEVLVASGDKDLLQIVNDRIKILDTMKNKVIGLEGVVEKFGVNPNQVADYLALVGDSSDNVPGAKGIGPKSASQLLIEYKTLDSLLSAELPTKIKSKIDFSRDSIILSKKLVQLDVSLDVAAPLVPQGEIEKEKLNSLLLELGIKSLVNKF